MKACLILAFVICSALAVPSDVHSVVVRQRRELDILGNTRQLIEQLVTNLRKAAADALEAVRAFEAGLIEQGKQIREKIVADVQKLRDLVSSTIQGVMDKITGSGAAVRTCITSKRSDADALFNDTLAKTLECADERIGEIGVQIGNLKNNTQNAIEFANNALEQMKACVADNPGNILTVGVCLGTVVVKTEMKGVVFATQSGLSIARLNIGLATIPAALEVCAGSHLMAAGMVTAKIVMDIGTCSASSIYNTMTGNTNVDTLDNTV